MPRRAKPIEVPLALVREAVARGMAAPRDGWQVANLEILLIPGVARAMKKAHPGMSLQRVPGGYYVERFGSPWNSRDPNASLAWNGLHRGTGGWVDVADVYRALAGVRTQGEFNRVMQDGAQALSGAGLWVSNQDYFALPKENPRRRRNPPRTVYWVWHQAKSGGYNFWSDGTSLAKAIKTAKAAMHERQTYAPQDPIILVYVWPGTEDVMDTSGDPIAQWDPENGWSQMRVR